MQIKINHPTIYSYLISKEQLVTEGRKLTTRIEDLEERRNKIGLQIQKVKDKVIPLIEKEMAPKLHEFEAIGEVKAGKSANEVVIDVFDQVEEFKKMLREKNASAEGDTKPTPDAPQSN